MKRSRLALSLFLVCLPACGGNGQKAMPPDAGAGQQPDALASAADSASNAAVDVASETQVKSDAASEAAQLDGSSNADIGAVDASNDTPVGGDAASEAAQADAGDASLCFSPTSNLSLAYQPGAVGCVCDPAIDRDVCVQGKALVCANGHWAAVIDGPCMPVEPPRDAAPDQNLAMDSAADGMGTKCGDSTCQPGEFCVLGCVGICVCTAVPEGGVCPNGPCGCGSRVACAYVPPSYCSSTVPVGCRATDAGIAECVCA